MEGRPFGQAAVACALLALACGASAATIRVPADQPTIQAGINAAAAGDIVLVAPGTWSEAPVVSGRADRTDNLLTQAPHTAATVAASDWPHPYSREAAAFPLPFVRMHKFWPAVGRVDNPFGDRNLVCTCPAVEEYA